MHPPSKKEIISKLEIFLFIQSLPFKEPTCTHSYCVENWLEEVRHYIANKKYCERIERYAYENLELKRQTEKN